MAHRPDSEHLLPGQWVPALRQGSSEVASRAWEWLSGSAKALTLKQVVDDAIVGLAGSQTTDWSILVPLAQWARRLRRSDLLTHVLVDDGNRQVGRPTKEALLADPYVVDGAIRRRLSRSVDVVSGAYQDASDGQAHEWARFFEESGVTGAVTVWRVPVKSPSKTDAERFAAVDVDYSTQGYTLVDYDLRWSSRQSVLPGLSMPEDAPALSAWLSSGAVALRGFGRRRVVWFYYREQAKQGSALSTWAATLTELAWVPCQDGQYRRPAAVLPREDDVRDDAPVADLDAQLVEVLASEGVGFGTDIPEALSLRKLQKVGNQLGPADLAQLLGEVREAVQEEGDLRHFRDAVAKLEIPAGADRFPINRVVRRAGGRARGLLGGYLVDLPHIDAVLRNQLEHVQFPYSFPEMATGEQALAYIRETWARARVPVRGLADSVRDVLPVAHAYLLQDTPRSDVLRSLWEQALPDAMAFSDRRWVVLAGNPEIFLDDVGDRRFMPAHADIHLATNGHLGESDAARTAVAKALGIERLSKVCRLSWTWSGASQAAPRSRGVAVVWQLLRAVQEGGAGSDGTSPHVENVETLSLTVNFKGQSEEVIVNARLEGSTLRLAGAPVEFAADAAKEMLRSFGFGQRADLATDLTAMFAAIDDLGSFRLAERKFRRAFLSEDLQADTDQTPSEGAALPATRGNRRDFPDPCIDDADDTADGSVDRPLDEETPSGLKASPSHRTGKPPRRVTEGRGAIDARDPSYTSERAKAPQRALAELLQSALKGEVLPVPGEGDNTSTTDGGTDSANAANLGDEVYRAIVLRYERECGRDPVEGDPSQVGWDIRSVDQASKRERLIEVKGRGRLWDETEVVELSRAQVAKAFKAKGATSSDWWLYVVERIGDDQFRVLPIPNPAEVATKWMLEGGAWRQIADNPRKLHARP